MPKLQRRLSPCRLGVLRGLAYLKHFDLVNQHYCSSYEGSAAACKNIDLWERIRQATERMYRCIGIPAMANLDYSLKSTARNLAGAGMAARINSQIDSAEILLASERGIANNLKYIDYSNLSKPNLSAPDRVPSDHFQHHAVLMAMKDWRPFADGSPYVAEELGFQLLNQFRSGFWNNDRAIFNAGLDSYDETALASIGESIADCGVASSTSWRRTGSSGKIIGLRGEPPSSALLTSIPSLRFLAQELNPYLVPVLDGITASISSGMSQHPHRAADEACNPDQALGTMPFTDLSVMLRQSTYMITGYLGFTKVPLGQY